MPRVWWFQKGMTVEPLWRIIQVPVFLISLAAISFHFIRLITCHFSSIIIKTLSAACLNLCVDFDRLYFIHFISVWGWLWSWLAWDLSSFYFFNSSACIVRPLHTVYFQIIAKCSTVRGSPWLFSSEFSLAILFLHLTATAADSAALLSFNHSSSVFTVLRDALLPPLVWSIDLSSHHSTATDSNQSP